MMTKKAKEILNSFISLDTENDCFSINPLEEKTRDEIKFVLKTIEKLEKENQELKQYKEILQEFGLDLESPKIREVLICGLMFKEYREAIKILKEKYDIRLSSDYPEYDYNDKSLTGNLEYILDDEIPLTKKEYELLKEVFGNE